ncbi:uncharacterized protein B0H18DRAFT_1213865 [Fomitopsis serialis]|uniref:uncharacterized protein n=1 Tax=Fomitopsis serialis TaxID=139415 RepID=UPI002008420B|nr:uncharacterized protein B0H18DRAFT_1213865 [Neoantrodia serialis]KAH9919428.1 hypothetical protein B0H18DRAFT_1213865 [Neoantrodia serialis]
MHRPLTIQDFIQLVVNEVARPCPLEERTLLALALTCRAFQEAALDMLWAHQDGLGRLVQCLPEDLWTYSDDPLEDITLSEPTRATTQQDWQRFDVYARRVRTLDIDDSPYFKSQSIQIRSGENEHLAGGVHDITSASFRRLCDFRNLRRFGLNTEMRIILDDDAVQEMAMSWPRLEYLHFSSLESPPTSATLEGLAHLSRYCPSLSSLCINVQTRGTVVSADVIPGGGFCNRALEQIEFRMSFPFGNEAKIAAFLNAIFPNIRSLIGRGEGYGI